MGGFKIFRTRPDRPWGPLSLLYNGYRVFCGGKEAGGVALTTHPYLAPRLKEEYSYTSTPLWAFVKLTLIFYFPCILVADVYRIAFCHRHFVSAPSFSFACPHFISPHKYLDTRTCSTCCLFVFLEQFFCETGDACQQCNVLSTLTTLQFWAFRRVHKIAEGGWLLAWTYPSVHPLPLDGF